MANCQSLNVAVDSNNPAICPVRAFALVLRVKHLGQPPDLPVCFYTNKNGEKLYLTGSKIAELFRKAVKSCRPDTPKEELSKYSAHSIRVWACVLLDEAGKSPDFIKKRLRWMGDSFRMYLRDTRVITNQHNDDALKSASAKVTKLIGTMASPSNNPLLDEVPTLVDEDIEIGEYSDEMD
jgi:hypothetical protein